MDKLSLNSRILEEHLGQSQASRAFWWCQIIGWGLFALLNMTVRGYFLHFSFGELANSVALFIGFVVSTSLLRRYYQRYLRSDNTLRNLLQIALASVVSAIITELLVFALIYPNYQRIFGVAPTNALQEALMSLPNLIFFTLLWSAVYVIVRRQRQLRSTQAQAEHLDTSLKAAQLDVLMNQLNPHFVFNAINNIRALILEDKSKARDCLADLSDVMRVTMQVKQDKVWPFKQELQLVKSYINLNALQFEDRLVVDWQIAENTYHQSFPCMMLQLLVENAIKHGINQRREGGQIRIQTNIIDNIFTLTVTNPGELLNEQHSSGIGLTNIQARLHIMHQQDSLKGIKPTFELMEKNGQVSATLTLGEYCD